MPDFSMTGVVTAGNADTTPIDPMQNMGAAGVETGKYLKGVKDRADDSQRFDKAFKFESNHVDGTSTLTAPTAAIQEYMKSYREMGQIRQIHQKQIQENQAQQEYMKAHPFANALAQIAASVGASSKDPLVRGLGDAAQRLNPTMDQLQQRQQGMMEGYGRSVTESSEMRNRTAALVQNEKRLQQTEHRDRALEISRIEGQGSREAMVGNFDPATHEKQLLLGGAPPEVAKASAERLGKVNEDAKLNAALKEKLSDDKEDRKLKNALAAKSAADLEHDRRQEKLWEHQLDVQEKKDAKRTTEQASKEKELPKTVSDKMADISAARKSADQLMKMMQDPEVTRILGPVRGRITDISAAIGNIKDSRDARTVARIKQQFAQAVQTLGAGARGYSQSERPFLLTFSEAIHNSPEQNIGNLKAWMEFYDNKEYGFKLAHPKADFDRFHPEGTTAAPVKAQSSHKSGEVTFGGKKYSYTVEP